MNLPVETVVKSTSVCFCRGGFLAMLEMYFPLPGATAEVDLFFLVALGQQMSHVGDQRERKDLAWATLLSVDWNSVGDAGCFQ